MTQNSMAVDERQCPFCGKALAWIDGKDKRKYADHVDGHAPERGYTLNGQLLRFVNSWRREVAHMESGTSQQKYAAGYITKILDDLEELVND